MPTLPADLLSRIPSGAGGSTSSAQAQEVETFAEVVLAIAALGEAMVAAGTSGSGSTTQEVVSGLEVIADMFDLVAAGRMRREHPAVWAVLRLLNLITDDVAQLANLGNLVGDTHHYLTGLVTGPGYAQTFQDYSAAILASLGTALSFLPRGSAPTTHDRPVSAPRCFTAGHRVAHRPPRNLAQILGRTLTWRLDSGGQPGVGAGHRRDVDSVALVPPEHN